MHMHSYQLSQSFFELLPVITTSTKLGLRFELVSAG